MAVTQAHSTMIRTVGVDIASILPKPKGASSRFGPNPHRRLMPRATARAALQGEWVSRALRHCRSWRDSVVDLALRFPALILRGRTRCAGRGGLQLDLLRQNKARVWSRGSTPRLLPDSASRLIPRWADDDDEDEEGPKVQTKRGGKNQPPPQGKRKGWVPREVGDFADGGAFPEIHVAQFPLDMGRKDGSTSKTVALQMDSEGNIKYDAILHQGRNHKTLIQGSARDLVAKKVHEMDVDRPDEEAIMQKTQETQAALEKIINGKLTAAKVARPEINQKKAGKCGARQR